MTIFNVSVFSCVRVILFEHITRYVAMAAMIITTTSRRVHGWSRARVAMAAFKVSTWLQQYDNDSGQDGYVE